MYHCSDFLLPNLLERLMVHEMKDQRSPQDLDCPQNFSKSQLVQSIRKSCERWLLITATAAHHSRTAEDTRISLEDNPVLHEHKICSYNRV